MMTVWQQQKAGWVVIAHSVSQQLMMHRQAIPRGDASGNRLAASRSGPHCRQGSRRPSARAARLVRPASAATFPGARLAIPTASGSAKSCCNRRAWPPCLTTTGFSSSAFRTSQALAAASEDAVLAAWSGLGYYRRARMLHRCARQIVEQHGGCFPQIRSPARPARHRTLHRRRHRQHRVCRARRRGRWQCRARAAKIDRQKIDWQRSHHAANLATRASASRRSRPGDFNQAMMELGATVCVPREPRCPCARFGNGAHAGRASRSASARPPPAKGRKKSGALEWRNRDGNGAGQWAKFGWCNARKAFAHARHVGTAAIVRTSARSAGCSAWRTFRHSITTTDYTVHVLRNAPAFCRLPLRPPQRASGSQSIASQSFPSPG
jgi:hypothetical protein